MGNIASLRLPRRKRAAAVDNSTGHGRYSGSLPFTHIPNMETEYWHVISGISKEEAAGVQGRRERKTGVNGWMDTADGWGEIRRFSCSVRKRRGDAWKKMVRDKSKGSG